jgi:hypothetical protein
MNFDLISTAELSAGAAIVSMTLVWIFARTLTQRIVIATTIALWFAAVLFIGSTGILAPTRLGTPVLGVAVLLPVITLSIFALGTNRGRSSILQTPLPALIAIHAFRALGFTFVVLYTAGRLPGPFAPAAGWGDIFIGVTALPLAWFISRNNGNNLAYNLLWLWNILGLLDLVNAIALGATSSPGPIQLFHVTPDTSLMTTLPWIIVPCFLVPALAFFHIATFYRLRHLQPSTATAFATS